MAPITFERAEGDLIAALLRDFIAEQERIARSDDSINARIEALRDIESARRALDKVVDA